jgi:hypothetical protein
MSAPVVIAAAVALSVAWYWDALSWRRKPREDLVRMLQSDDWRFHNAAIKELRRRGQEVVLYLPRIAALLVADSKVKRAGAHVTIKDCFPDLAVEIQDYSPTAGIESCRAKAAPLLSRFPFKT